MNTFLRSVILGCYNESNKNKSSFLKLVKIRTGLADSSLVNSGIENYTRLQVFLGTLVIEE